MTKTAQSKNRLAGSAEPARPGKPRARRPRARVPPPTEQLIEYLAEIDLRVGELALALREIVLSEATDATEIVFKSYVVVTNYSFTGKWTDAFCYIAVYPRHVNLGFNRGAELEDPESLLIGKGRIFRHLKIAGSDDLKKPHLHAFIRAAIRHNKAELAERPPKPSSGSAAKRAAKTRRRR